MSIDCVYRSLPNHHIQAVDTINRHTVSTCQAHFHREGNRIACGVILTGVPALDVALWGRREGGVGGV